MGIFEQHATLFFAAVAVIGGAAGYLGASVHRFVERGKRWQRRS